tara:strand:- start:52 stop:324 length:273 start_codon:yes stop_codon:yes gene_type:complete
MKKTVTINKDDSLVSLKVSDLAIDKPQPYKIYSLLVDGIIINKKPMTKKDIVNLGRHYIKEGHDDVSWSRAAIIDGQRRTDLYCLNNEEA